MDGMHRVTRVLMSDYPLFPAQPRWVNIFPATSVLMIFGFSAYAVIDSLNERHIEKATIFVLIGLGVPATILFSVTVRNLLAWILMRRSGATGWVFSRAVRISNGGPVWKEGAGYVTAGDTLRVHLSGRIDETPWVDVISASRLETPSGAYARPLLDLALSDGAHIYLEIVHASMRDFISSAAHMIDNAAAAIDRKAGHQSPAS